MNKSDIENRAANLAGRAEAAVGAFADDVKSRVEESATQAAGQQCIVQRPQLRHDRIACFTNKGRVLRGLDQLFNSVTELVYNPFG